MTRLLTMVVAAVMMVGGAWAQSPVTLDQVQDITERAAHLLLDRGIDRARKVFHAQGDFRFGEIYVNVIDENGTWLVYPPNPRHEGRSVLNVTDADGKLIVQDIITMAKEKGEGWVGYRWLNPVSNRIEPKQTFVKHIPQLGVIAYVGVYR